MDLENNIGVYGLITELCERFAEKQNPSNDHPYLPKKDNTKIVKKLRSQAYGILLNKCSDANKFNVKWKNKLGDPIVELLKHSYHLRIRKNGISRAKNLENVLDKLNEEDIDSTVCSILYFLIELRSLENKEEFSLNIFHYGKANPVLPEICWDGKGVMPFQTYPIESFVLPEKFETVLGIKGSSIIQDCTAEPGSNLSFLGQFRSATMIETESTRNDSAPLSIMYSISRGNLALPSVKDFTMGMHFLPQIMEDNGNPNEDYHNEKEEHFSVEAKSLWPEITSVHTGMESESQIDQIETLNKNDSYQESEGTTDLFSSISDKELETECIPNHRTWETLGQLNPPKEPRFLTETKEAMLHLEKIRLATIAPLLQKNALESLTEITEVSSKEFLSNIKLLLLGIESDNFHYSNMFGFQLQQNTVISGVSAEMLQDVCRKPIEWGNSFRALSMLITCNPETGKLQKDGLIFKAMCNSIKEFFLCYQAAVLRISVDKNSERPGAILQVLDTLGPLGDMIVEVAVLCRCDDKSDSMLEKGISVLTHIYEEVTKVTQPDIALIFYSILKSCCEVYFRFLQRWLFEGVCEDEYEEFMIQMRPQYLRQRGRKFWTKGFGINTKSVPRFLDSLTESILQCGKAVRLLKLCDPKNPLCGVFATSHPAVRVCLSVDQLREQAMHCQEYMTRGQDALGNVVSLSTAFQDQRKVERQRAELVSIAQQDTLLRIKREREESIKILAQNKRDLLAKLKNQAEEAVLRKEKDKEAQLLADKLLAEKVNREQEEADRINCLEKANILNYYNELAAEAERRRVRAEWRIKRMQLFDNRIIAISSARHELWESKDEPLTEAINKSDMIQTDENDKQEIIREEEVESVRPEKPEVDAEVNIQLTDFGTEPSDRNANTCPDENSNLDNTRVSNNISCILDISNKTTDLEPAVNTSTKDDVKFHPDHKSTMEVHQSVSIKSPRPTVLDITPITLSIEPVNQQMNPQKEQALQRNRAKMMLHTTFSSCDYDQQNKNNADDQFHDIPIAQTEKLANRLRNTNSSVQFSDVINIMDVNNDLMANRFEFLKLRNADNMTDLQRNRLKVLQQEYSLTPNNNEGNLIFLENDIQRRQNTERIDEVHEASDDEPQPRFKTTRFTEAQRNRARVMEQEFYIYGTGTVEKTNEASSAGSSAGTPALTMSFSTTYHDAFDGTTPMSCTTDNFPLSMSSSMSQIPPYSDTPLSEIGSEVPSIIATAEIPTGDISSSHVTESGFKFPQRTTIYPNFVGFGSAALTPTSESTLTAADVEMIDNTSLQVYLEKSVMIPLRIQSHLVNDALIKYLLCEHNMLSHMTSLRSYFFLLNGEFAKSLTNSLYTGLYSTSVSMELLNSATLTNILERALMSSLNNSYTNSEFLSLSTVDVPPRFLYSDPDALDCLSLNYKISWPLNIILDENSMLQYTKVFKFLISVGRVIWVLQEDFHILKVERKAMNSKQYHKLQLYRHAMMQFVNALHNYLTCSVLHASWNEFEKDLEQAITLDQVYYTHVSYIKKILSRCMLNANGAKMRSSLRSIFKVILKFHNRVRSQNWIREPNGYMHPNYEKLEQMYESFCELRTYLAYVADRFASSGYQPHLVHFLDALNINPLFDMTIKKT
ncbi:gamma-tubulin complex component 6 isoform X2 [Cephus cinctus]|uniref:Gamma-tubulin complex component 6 isoform X2 n=1 Tax=Cephus cinctus TaxID=211228 RepID=A0AAJ7BQC0_CEPCN|nr:gamma-tubulin complex component 6 isoform X2 [Cephus cinctus]